MAFPVLGTIYGPYVPYSIEPCKAPKKHLRPREALGPAGVRGRGRRQVVYLVASTPTLSAMSTRRTRLTTALLFALAGAAACGPPRREVVIVHERDGREEVVEVEPPADRAEEIGAAPSAEHVWIRGHWQRRGGEWAWDRGHWEVRRVGHEWIPGHWERRPRGHVWIEGHWRRL